MGYRWNRLDEPIFMAGSKPMRTEFGICQRLESCGLFSCQLEASFVFALLGKRERNWPYRRLKSDFYTLGRLLMASAVLFPIFLSWLFTLVQWCSLEKEWEQKLKTLTLTSPFLLLYPQWRKMRVIYYAKWRKDPRWKEMAEDCNSRVSALGK